LTVDEKIGRVRHRLVAATLVAQILGMVAVSAAAAEDGSILPRSYAGPFYGSTTGLEAPTASKPQSKLWFNDGSWWALMVQDEDSTLRIAELSRRHEWKYTDTVVSGTAASGGDVLFLDGQLHVLTTDDAGLLVQRFTYEAGSRAFEPQPGFPVVVDSRRPASASQVVDGAGRTWVSYLRFGRVTVAHSDVSGTEWAEPFSPATPATDVGPGETADIVHFDGGVGVLWSDQQRDSFHFAVHPDDAPDDSWSYETALQGPDIADNHINAKVWDGPGGSNIIAAVKTSLGDSSDDPEQTLTLVLRRSPQGQWSSHVTGTVRDNLTRPVVAVDPVNRTVYTVASRFGAIVLKEAKLPRLDFPTGPGTVVISSPSRELTDVTSTDQPLTPVSGLVIMVSDRAQERYWHAEMPITAPLDVPVPGLDPDDEPPSEPGHVRAREVDGSVTVTWSRSDDGDGWSPAADERPVNGYAVYRDGRRLGLTRSTYFADAPGRAGRVTYSVKAVDLAGNLSSAAHASVRLGPGTADRQIAWTTVGLVAGVMGTLAFAGWLFARR